MKADFSRVISLTLITFGLLIVGWNSISFLQGYLSVENIEYTKADVERVSQPQMKGKELKKKELTLYPNKPLEGEKLGELTIPKLNRVFPIYEGTSAEVLKKGVGHFSKSVLPGESNNSILSGHRDTVFRGLGELKIHDPLVVTTDFGEFLYKIRRIKIVDAEDRTVMTPKPKGTLTVTTCYPFYFIGDAPQRYVITADLISSKRN
ncbi:class D sortase [Cytobacillus sp. FJAT-54145]|uniref:Class D sortase n=1 Tax=Cytobacillus spartinae TaxID=3299023 RepID=A0ABW6K994_9BACI